MLLKIHVLSMLDNVKYKLDGKSKFGISGHSQLNVL